MEQEAEKPRKKKFQRIFHYFTELRNSSGSQSKVKKDHILGIIKLSLPKTATNPTPNQLLIVLKSSTYLPYLHKKKGRTISVRRWHYLDYNNPSINNVQHTIKNYQTQGRGKNHMASNEEKKKSGGGRRGVKISLMSEVEENKFKVL